MILLLAVLAFSGASHPDSGIAAVTIFPVPLGQLHYWPFASKNKQKPQGYHYSHFGY
jgi:hypothetical protein